MSNGDSITATFYRTRSSAVHHSNVAFITAQRKWPPCACLCVLKRDKLQVPASPIKSHGCVSSTTIALCIWHNPACVRPCQMRVSAQVIQFVFRRQRTARVMLNDVRAVLSASSLMPPDCSRSHSTGCRSGATRQNNAGGFPPNICACIGGEEQKEKYNGRLSSYV